MAFKSVLGSLAVLVYVLHCNVAVSDAGTSYVHWGRSSCGPYARLLYKGFVAGSHFTHVGGGANSLCVPETGDFANTVDGQQNSASLWGTEFELSMPDYSNLFSTVNNNKKKLHDYDAVCALCYIPSSTDNFMLPGRQDCGEGNSDFNLLYKGYLMSMHRTFAARVGYICVDEAPEGRPGSESNENGNLLYPVEVEGACKSLPCPGYESLHEVTCAVCAN